MKAKSAADLLKMAEILEIENASTMRKGEMMFAILKEKSEDGAEVSGEGVMEVMSDGFGFYALLKQIIYLDLKIFMYLQR